MHRNDDAGGIDRVVDIPAPDSGNGYIGARHAGPHDAVDAPYDGA
jgi:hypothetical protein